MSDVFISYASADRERAKRLAEALEAKGYSAWWDRQIAPGQTFDEVIERALNDAKCVVVLWSSASVTSDWVKTEASEAAKRKILVPALIDAATIPLEFRRIQAADLTHWDGRTDEPEFEKFIAAIDIELQSNDRTMSPAPPPRTVVSSKSGTAAAMAPAPVQAQQRDSTPLSAPPPQRGIGKWVLVALVLLAAVAGSIFLLRPEGGAQIAGVETPDVVGMPFEKGAALLAGASLLPERQDRPSEVYLPGIILEQLPPPGTTLAENAKVTLAVAASIEPPPAADTNPDAPAAEPAPEAMATVPDLKGQTVQQAIESLTAAGFKLGEQKGVPNNDVSLGTIVSQEPESSQSRAKDSGVSITVVTKRTVPDLMGMNLQKAREILAKLGLSEQSERVQASRGQADDSVTAQSPAAGTEIEGGGQTRLTIATITPKRIFGGDDLYKIGGQKCVQICKENGLKWPDGRWVGSSGTPRNTCFCGF